MSWITLGAIPLQGIEHNNLMHFAFRVLSSSNETNAVHEAAADAVCSLLERLEELSESVSGTSPPF